MPNWCETDFRFHGKRAQLEKLYNFIDSATEQQVINNDFSDEWLGNVLYAAYRRAGVLPPIAESYVNLKTVEVTTNAQDEVVYSKRPLIPCRGIIKDNGFMLDGSLRVETLTAWEEMPDMWTIVLSSLQLDSVHFNYFTSESDNEYYAVHDPNEEDFRNHDYMVDVWNEAHRESFMRSQEQKPFFGSGKYNLDTLLHDLYLVMQQYHLDDNGEYMPTSNIPSYIEESVGKINQMKDINVRVVPILKK